MSNRDLYIALYLAVVASGAPSNTYNVAEYTRQLFDQLQSELDKL